MSSPPATADRTVALNRFGLGRRPADPLPSSPRDWLLGQLDAYRPAPPALSDALPSARIAADYAEGREEFRDGESAEQKMAARKALRQKGQALYRSEVEMRIAAALETDTPFVERLVHFWSNHFAISANKPQVTVLAGAFEREAIRPHVLGRFEDMLVAVERHAAMQVFLDQVRSVGPNSRFAERAAARNAARKPGINENLAREIMELHTLGVRTGYTQADVTQFALALTGWSVGRMGAAAQDQDPGVFAFRPALHEPGTRTIRGKAYPQDGEAQARAVLADLAASEATARHLATKLARHFVADEPPPEVVEALAAAYLGSGGDLPAVYRALVAHPLAWTPQPQKFKTPWEWTVSSLRGLGWRTTPDKLPLAPLLNQLGQPTWRPGSPAGYDDIAASWAAPDALVRRVEVAQRLANRAPDGLDARELAPELFPDTLSPLTSREIGRAESARTALALLLVSPDFQRR